LSVPAQACSEFETPTDSFSQAFLSVHAAPAPPVQWIHSTLNTYTCNIASHSCSSILELCSRYVLLQ
jgi:hypothetical protein